MLNIRETLGLRKFDSPFGVEVENEYADELPEIPRDGADFYLFWGRKADGSLRGASEEIVSKASMSRDNWDQACELYDMLMLESGWENSPRAATHIHINMQEKEFKDIPVIAAAWWWMEPLLIKSIDPSRVGNLFCLGLREANFGAFHFSRSAGHPAGMYHALYRDYRYAALNLAAIQKFGSIEFRCFPSTKSSKELDKWLNLCYTVSEVHKEFETPDKLMDFVFQHDAKDVLYRFTGSDVLVDGMTRLNDWRDELTENEGMLVDYAYGGTMVVPHDDDEEEPQEDHGFIIDLDDVVDREDVDDVEF